MRVALLGAAGTIAPVIARDLAASEEISGLLLLDLDLAAAERVATSCGGGGVVDAERADARDGLAEHLAGCDLLVNSASYRVNLDAMRACLEAGCHYVDLGGLYWMTGRQLELHDEFAGAGLLALLGLGSSPGKTNLMAAAAVRGMDGVAAIDVAAAGRDLGAGSALSVPYALQTLLDELTMAPVVLREGAPVELEPLAGGGAVDYGEPIGSQETIYTLHSELATFGASFGCSSCSFRLSLAPRLEASLRALIGASSTQVEDFARACVPASSQTVSVHRVDCLGDDGRHVVARAVTGPYEPFGVGGSVISTAAPAAAFARLLARGEVEERGALPPERCIAPESLFAELSQRGCEFSIEEAP
jgi:saccharopine dehydrogenase (NAD+, L-lysine-forming)